MFAEMTMFVYYTVQAESPGGLAVKIFTCAIEGLADMEVAWET